MPLDTSHNSIFFKYPLNYNIDQTNDNAKKVSDNDYNTYASVNHGNSISIKIGDSNSKYTHIFIKSRGLSGITGDIGSDTDFGMSNIPTQIRKYDTPISSNFIRNQDYNTGDIILYSTIYYKVLRPISSDNAIYGSASKPLQTVINEFISAGRIGIGSNPNSFINQSYTELRYPKDKENMPAYSGNGYDNYLIKRTSEGNSAGISLTFYGSNIRIYEIMILEALFELAANSKFTKFEYKLTDRTGLIQQDIAGGLSKARAINNARWKHDIDYGAIFYNSESSDEILNFMQEHPNFAFAVEYSRYPHMVFPAVFPNLDAQIQFLTRIKGDHNVFFQISEA